jgi:hypothetical protein
MGLILPPWYRRRGKPQAVPGSASYASPGSYTLIVPEYNTFVADVYGAGGGGGGAAWYEDDYNLATGGIQLGEGVGGPNGTYPGYAYVLGQVGGGGGYSQFYANATGYNVVAYGGSGGPGGDWWHSSAQSGTMPQGANGYPAGNYSGGSTGGGMAGGQYGYTSSYSPQVGGYCTTYGGYGGWGGRAYMYFSPGQLPVGSSILIVVGQGGAPGWQQQPYSGQYGGNGVVNVSWS